MLTWLFGKRKNRKYYLSSDVPIRAISRDFDTPQKISRWILGNIKYITDKKKHGLKDYWQTPIETLKDGTGDCEDFAILAQAILKELGIKAGIMGVFNQSMGHAVCFFLYNNIWYHFSNWGLVKCGPCFDNIQSKVYKDWKIWRLHEPNGSITEEHVLVCGKTRRTR